MIADRPGAAAVGGDEGESESETYSEIGSTGQWGDRILENLGTTTESDEVK